jgi:hypothetical protein
MVAPLALLTSAACAAPWFFLAPMISRRLGARTIRALDVLLNNLAQSA